MLETPAKCSDDASIERTIGDFHRKMQALVALSKSHLKHAKENQDRDKDELTRKLTNAIETIEKAEGGNLDSLDMARIVSTIIDCNSSLASLNAVAHDDMLAEILFVSAFSNFDAYLNHLLRCLLARPKLLKTMDAKEVLFADILNRTKDEIIAGKVDAELNSLLRESYIKIFDKLANRFDAKTLTGFPNWPSFVECSQRRNVIVHCDGIAGQQYIETCKSVGADVAGVAIGQKLNVSSEYLLRSVEVVTETGLKLGQVLWRTSSDESVGAADAHLANLLFELLKREEWTLARRMGEFGRILARRTPPLPRSERSQKIIIINHAQAAKWSGHNDAALQIIGEYDWSGSAFEFRLAVACLRGEWDTAAALMGKIGVDESVIPVHGYVGWPIFREFRNTPQFLTAFRSIFGVEFAAEVKKAGTETSDNGENRDAH